MHRNKMTSVEHDLIVKEIEAFQHVPVKPFFPQELNQYNFDWSNPDYKSVISKRLRRLAFIKDDIARQGHKHVGTAYASSCAVYTKHPARFIEDWGITYDPRKAFAIMPFMLFPRQKEYIEWLHQKYLNKQDGLAEKSRDVGFTWLNVAFAIWMLRFCPNSKVGFGSRKEALVDKLGDPDSIFEKARMFLKYLPDIFCPNYEANFLKIINKDNGAVITGEGGDNIGRGGRSTMYFKDESAFYERPLLIEAALSQNSDVKIDVSTPNGIGNPFYTKRHSGKVDVFTFHWRDDPRKDDAWYKKQKDTLDPIIVAQEIDIDYHASIEDICIPNEYVKAAIQLDLGDDARGEKRAGLDVSDEGGDANAYIFVDGVVVEKIESWKLGNTSKTTQKAYGLALQHGCPLIKYDSIGVGAGVKGESRRLMDKSGAVKFVGVNSGCSPTQGEYAPGKMNADMFSNLKAEMWWKMRRRFEKTYEHVVLGKEYPLDELISIPNDGQLIAELSQPKYEVLENGRIRIESKVKMRKRGIKSPNKADALVIAFQKSETLFRLRRIG